MNAWNFLLVTFGCKVNQYETQSIREAWTRLGGTECGRAAEADVILVNSCAITGKGERDARNAVFRLRRESPGARILLTGCATRLFAAFTPRKGAEWAEPDLLVPQEEKWRLLTGPWPYPTDESAGRKAITGPKTVHRENRFPPFSIAAFKRARPVLKVQDGCAHRCTYCIVPHTRTLPSSREPAEAVAEARRLFSAGYAEIMISGINLNQYGRDDARFGDFWDLLRRLDSELAPEFTGRGRFRVSSLEPTQLTEKGLDTLASCRMLCPHLHISLQHASQAVLKRMGRGHYSADDLTNALIRLKRQWPVMGLGCDLLMGFPGETEADVETMLQYVAETPLSYAHVFPYSQRPGTPAAGFSPQVPQRERIERARRVREAVAEKRAVFWQAQLSLEAVAVVSDGAEGKSHGVNEYYVPCRFERADGVLERRGILKARPIALTEKGLTVRPVD